MSSIPGELKEGERNDLTSEGEGHLIFSQERAGWGERVSMKGVLRECEW